MENAMFKKCLICGKDTEGNKTFCNKCHTVLDGHENDRWWRSLAKLLSDTGITFKNTGTYQEKDKTEPTNVCYTFVSVNNAYMSIIFVQNEFRILNNEYFNTVFDNSYIREELDKWLYGKPYANIEHIQEQPASDTCNNVAYDMYCPTCGFSYGTISVPFKTNVVCRYCMPLLKEGIKIEGKLVHYVRKLHAKDATITSLKQTIRDGVDVPYVPPKFKKI